MLAAQCGHNGVVGALLAAPGIDVNTASKEGKTVLMFSAESGNTDIVEALKNKQDHNIDVNKADANGRTALVLAASNGHTEVVKALLGIPEPANEGHQRAQVNSFPLIDVNKADNYGWTAVMKAAQCGHTEVVKDLLAAPGIDIHKRSTGGDLKGKTALGIATHYNRHTIARLLRTEGAEEDTEMQRRLQATPTAANPYACRYASKSQADIAANKAKRLPWGILKRHPGKLIYDAAEKGDMAKLGPLVDEWFANDVLNWINPKADGFNPLIVCSKGGKVEAVNLLLAATTGVKRGPFPTCRVFFPYSYR